MMICIALGGGGAATTEVSVLCGAGGGFTVHAVAKPNTEINATATPLRRRKVVGTPFRVSGGAGAAPAAT
jgi:hypothetical protein